MNSIPLTNNRLPHGAGPWHLPDGWTYDPAGGPDGGPALRHVRTDPTEYQNARLRLLLTPGERYRVTGRLLLEQAAGRQAAACAGIEFFDAENRYLGGGYFTAVTTPGVWTAGETEFTVPAFTAECRLMFYLRAGEAGAARFAAPAIGPAPLRWAVFLLTPVRDELPAAGGSIPLGFFAQGKPGPDRPLAAPDGEGWRCTAELLAGARRIAAPATSISSGRTVLEFGRLPAGPATLTVTLHDPRGALAGEQRIPVTVVEPGPERDRAARGAALDARGRILVAGRPFLPVGLYLGGVQPHELDELAASPFNCILPYGSPSLKFDGSSHTGVAAVREVLDACALRGLKVIFSLANTYDDHANAFLEALGVRGGFAVAQTALREFKDHPALLAWYVNDEQPLERLPLLLERRRALRTLDPAHPLYAVMCQWPELPFYTPLADVYGIDPYPIADPACNHIRAARYAHDMAERAARTDHGIALWTVVQAHNLGIYDPQAAKDPTFYRQTYRDPTRDEMLALALLAAIRGAKGFIFYSYFDLPRPAFDTGARDRRWNTLREVAQVLRELEPFLLADADGPPLLPRVQEGEVETRAFRDATGRHRVLVVGIGPGVCRAEFALPGPSGWRSRFGRTVARGSGLHVFEGRDVCADVLEEG